MHVRGSERRRPRREVSRGRRSPFSLVVVGAAAGSRYHHREASEGQLRQHKVGTGFRDRAVGILCKKLHTAATTKRAAKSSSALWALSAVDDSWRDEGFGVLASFLPGPTCSFAPPFGFFRSKSKKSVRPGMYVESALPQPEVSGLKPSRSKTAELVIATCASGKEPSASPTATTRST